MSPLEKKLFFKINDIEVINLRVLPSRLKEIKIRDNQKSFFKILNEYNKFFYDYSRYSDKEGIEVNAKILLNPKIAYANSNWSEEFQIEFEPKHYEHTDFLLLSMPDKNNVLKKLLVAYKYLNYNALLTGLKEFRNGKNPESIKSVCPICGKKIKRNSRNIRGETISAETYQLYHLGCRTKEDGGWTIFRQPENIFRRMKSFQMLLIDNQTAKKEPKEKHFLDKHYINAVYQTLIKTIKSGEKLHQLTEISGISEKQLNNLVLQIYNELKENNDSKLLDYLTYAFESRYLRRMFYGQVTQDEISFEDDYRVRDKYFSSDIKLKNAFNIIINILSDNKEIKTINKYTNEKIVQQNTSNSTRRLKNIHIIREVGNTPSYVTASKGIKRVHFIPTAYDTVTGQQIEIWDLEQYDDTYDADDIQNLDKEEQQEMIDEVKKYEKEIIMQSQDDERTIQGEDGYNSGGNRLKTYADNPDIFKPDFK